MPPTLVVASMRHQEEETQGKQLATYCIYLFQPFAHSAFKLHI